MFPDLAKSQHFNYSKIHTRQGYNHRWDFGPLSNQQQEVIKSLTQSPLKPLHSGQYYYIFSSADNKYVVKFIKQRNIDPKHIISFFPLPKELEALKRDFLNSMKNNRGSIFNSFQISYERIPDLTGVVYLHLNRTKSINKSVELQVTQNKKIQIKLDDTEFIVQKKAQPITLNDLKVLPNVYTLLSEVVKMHGDKLKKGVKDGCTLKIKNLGIIDGKIVQLNTTQFENSSDQVLPTQDSNDSLNEIYKKIVEIHPKHRNDFDIIISSLQSV